VEIRLLQHAVLAGQELLQTSQEPELFMAGVVVAVLFLLLRGLVV
jgi:hypothetical protein